MADNTELDLDSQNQAIGVDDIDFANADAAKEAYQSLLDNHSKVADTNKQLYSRAKKAEGFELKDGKWVKPVKVEPKNDTLPSKEPSKPNELDYGQLALLRTEGVKGSEELALFKEVMRETGKEVLDVLDSNYFKSRLNDLREAKASADAIPKGKGRPGQISVTDVDLAVARYKETGELPQDFATRNKVIDVITAEEKGDLFQGPSVIK